MSAPQEKPDLRAADGRVPGRRGLATRQRLLECTAGLLRHTSYRDLKVIDIAREAGTSPATFYQYFPDVEAAVLVLATAMSEQGPRLTALITAAPWGGRSGYDTATQLVDGFIDFWEEHRAVLRVVDLAIAEGDSKFQQARTKLLNEVSTALRDVIASFQGAGRHPATIEPMAHAATLVSMLAHVAAHHYGFEAWGIRMDHIRKSMSRTVYWSVTGRRPPDA